MAVFGILLLYLQPIKRKGEHLVIISNEGKNNKLNE